MDWDLAMTRNREALERVLALLVAMASAAVAGAVEAACPTLPRHLHRAVLRLLRPAESAARRLVIVAARDVVVPTPRLREPKPPRRKPRPTGVVFPPGVRRGTPPVAPRAAPARISLPLFDTLRPPSRRPRRIAARNAPRISLPGLTAPYPPPPPKPMPFDTIDATRVRLRIAALAAVLDDLPAQAIRFARWRARRDAQLRERVVKSPERGPDGRPAVHRPRRFIRLSPLRPGRPPGTDRRSTHEVHAVLRDLQQLAWWVLEHDTS